LSRRAFLSSLQQQNKKAIIMKKIIILSMMALVTAMPMQAQQYRNSRYYNQRSGRLDYKNGRRSSRQYRHDRREGDVYYGFRIGPSFSTVNSDDQYLNGGDSQTGLNVGFVVGLGLSPATPLYLETGLSYIEKGGKNNYDSKKMTYDLNYIELPLVLKYRYMVADGLSIEPFLGGYLAEGVSGKIKNFGNRVAYNSFSDDGFKHFDGGLKFGCGLSYDLFYADLSYDLGLANISHDFFDTSHNRTLFLTVGVNF
jgi:hypothetical protein